MKKPALVLIAAMVTAGIASAQGVPWNRPSWSTDQTQPVKVSGKLALINGMIGIQSGGKTFYTPMLGHLAGFITGLSEGASVSLEGYAYTMPVAPEYSMLAVTKLTVGGKDYDLSTAGYGQFGPGRHGMFGGRGMHGGPCDGRTW
jgi:hypothetical protein